MTSTTKRSDFSFADLKEENITIYLVLPPDRLATIEWLLDTLHARRSSDLLVSSIASL